MEEALTPESSRFDFDGEKFNDAISMGTISKQTILDLECMEKENFIKSNTDIDTYVGFSHWKDITFSFLSMYKK